MDEVEFFKTTRRIYNSNTDSMRHYLALAQLLYATYAPQRLTIHSNAILSETTVVMVANANIGLRR